VRQGVRGSCDRLLCVVDRRLEFRSGLLRLIAVVEGKQRLPSSAEMVGPEALERIRPLRCEQRWRCERLDLLIAMIVIIVPRTSGVRCRVEKVGTVSFDAMPMATRMQSSDATASCLVKKKQSGSPAHQTRLMSFWAASSQLSRRDFRRLASPIPASPIRSIAHVEGSGTDDAIENPGDLLR